MYTILKTEKTESNQKLAKFTGEGAYHGSSQTKVGAMSPEIASEVPQVILQHLATQKKRFDEFDAEFPNFYEIKESLGVPTQQQVQSDGVVFVWCEFDQAVKEAGPLTKRVLEAMEPHLKRDKKFIYVDSKIQFFKRGDLPVDSSLWHIDGSIAIRDERALSFGYTLLHDMKTRMTNGLEPNRYLAYQSSEHCRTEFLTEPVTIPLPECIPNFDILDARVKDSPFNHVSQPAGTIVAFDGISLHRAIPAIADGWRLWIRVVETDKEVKLNSSIINCYGTVFRQSEGI